MNIERGTTNKEVSKKFLSRRIFVSLRFLPAVLFMALIFFFSAMPNQDVLQGAKPFITKVPQTFRVSPTAKPLPIKWLKVGHFVGYFSLGLAYFWAIHPYKRRAWAIAILLAAAYAVTDEIHQTFVLGRTARLNDVALDTLAAAASVLLAIGLVRLKAAWLSHRLAFKRPVD